VIDLARTTQDALASKVSARLRKDYGFRATRRRSSASTACSRRSRFAAPAPTLRHGRPEFDAGAGLACAGYGSSVAVTAGFGFAAAARVLAGILPHDNAPVVLVTGAARRVGAEIARTLHAAGARVAIHCRASAPTPKPWRRA
jgi:tRNA A37 threonylcarbamoyladenosine dehydratase